MCTMSHDTDAMVKCVSFFARTAVGPLFLGPLSEIYGRSRVIQAANIFYLGMSSLCVYLSVSLSVASFLSFCLLYVVYWQLLPDVIYLAVSSITFS